MIFDPDASEGVTWPPIQEAARLTQAMLQELGLKAWLKASGGKGMHVIVPLAHKADYDPVNSFSKAVVQHIAKVIPRCQVAGTG